MVAAARAFVINPFGDQYPDDDSTKTVVLQAEGLAADYPDDRHVLLHWVNGMAVSHTTSQVAVPAILGAEHILRSRTIHESTARPDRRPCKGSQVQQKVTCQQLNNCQTWMRSLLMGMVDDGLLSVETFNKIDADVPLKKVVPELPEDVA